MSAFDTCKLPGILVTAVGVAMSFGVGAPLAAQSPATFHAGPGPRKGHTLVYDSREKSILLIDSSPRVSDSVSRHHELWRWDGTEWRLLAGSSAQTAPTGHTTGGAAYDSRRGVVVIYGGRIGAMMQNDVVGDTWNPRLR